MSLAATLVTNPSNFFTAGSLGSHGVIGMKHREFEDRGSPFTRIPGILLKMKQPSGKNRRLMQGACEANKTPDQRR